MELNENGSISLAITLPEGTCTVTLDSQTGDDWTFTVSGAVDAHTKRVQVTANRDTAVTVTSWQEVE